MALKDRIREAMEGAQLKPADLARATGKSGGAVTQWLDGTIKSLKAETAELMQQATGYSSAWLVTGKGEKLAEKTATILKVSGSPADRVEAMASMGAVPLISWVQAGCWADVADPFQPGDADEWLPCPVAHGPRCYAVKVRGDSMNNPGGRPSYSDGDIIFVDPDKGANHGDRVIVHLDDHAEATFKQLLIEDGRKLLKALNPEWSPRYIPINGNATIKGVVIGKWVPE